MTRAERYKFLLDYYSKKMPHVSTELEFGSVFQLLVATVLSAQCTDKRINQVTPELFSHYPDAKSMAQAEMEDVLELIKSVCLALVERLPTWCRRWVSVVRLLLLIPMCFV